METNSQLYKEKLYNQLEEAYGKVVYTYTTHIIQAGRIQKNNRQIKWAHIILSAISTGGFFGTIVSNQIIITWIGAICSTALLVLTAYFKDMDLSEKQSEHLNTSNQLWVIRENYLCLLTDFWELETSDVVAKRDQLQKETAQIYSVAPITDSKSYSLAQESLKEKESQYFSRDELNKMLPQSLRL